MAGMCAGPRPTAGCPYYVSWDAYVVLGDDWINVYGGGYSVAGGEWRRLGEAFIYPLSMVNRGYVGYNNDYYRYFDAIKLNPQSGGGYTLYGLGGMWGGPEGKKHADPDEFPFFYIWSPKEGKVTTTDFRFNFGGSQSHTDYYVNFGARCGGIPQFDTISCDRPKYFGTAAPPPPPPKNMNCCDCNTIATIVEAKNYDQLLTLQKLFEDLKDHIDKRSLEIILKDLEHLRALDFEEFLKAVIKRINEVESSLWNGIKQ